jgi:hypothetical protein
MQSYEEHDMRKDLREWIDKEIARLDLEIKGENPEGFDANPAPDELRLALAKISGQAPPDKQ